MIGIQTLSTVSTKQTNQKKKKEGKDNHCYISRDLIYIYIKEEERSS